MEKNYKILGKFIKDMSSETPDIETYLFVKDNISKYQLNIDITSKALKNKMIEIHTTLRFQDINETQKRSFFEIIYSTIIKIDEEINDKKTIEKIILCDVQKEIYPNLKLSFLNMLNDSGYPGIKLEKDIDFEKLYNDKFN
tara:strand:+ start:124 stop:546 length:423 start_codon:yes stop_codon:yes gene_type:complete